MPKMMELVDAAARLKVPYHLAHRWVLIGRLAGERRRGRWFVECRSVEVIAIELSKETVPAA